MASDAHIVQSALDRLSTALDTVRAVLREGGEKVGNGLRDLASNLRADTKARDDHAKLVRFGLDQVAEAMVELRAGMTEQSEAGPVSGLVLQLHPYDVGAGDDLTLFGIHWRVAAVRCRPDTSIYNFLVTRHNDPDPLRYYVHTHPDQNILLRVKPSGTGPAQVNHDEGIWAAAAFVRPDEAPEKEPSS